MKLIFDYKFRFYTSKMNEIFLYYHWLYFSSFILCLGQSGWEKGQKNSKNPRRDLIFLLFQSPYIFILWINLQKLSSGVWKWSQDKSAIPPFCKSHLLSQLSIRSLHRNSKKVKHNLNRCVRNVKKLNN